MGYSNIVIKTDPLDGTQLIAAGEARKGGAYLARITGTDPQYRYARQFLGQKSTNRAGIVTVAVLFRELAAEELLEIRAGGSWKNDYRNFYVLRQGGCTEPVDTLVCPATGADSRRTGALPAECAGHDEHKHDYRAVSCGDSEPHFHQITEARLRELLAARLAPGGVPAGASA